MNIKIQSFCNTAYAVIDNFYTNQELKSIWKELEFLGNEYGILNQKLDTKSAIDDQGNSLKNNSAVFLDTLYSNRNASPILRCNRKLFDKNLTEVLEKENIIFRYIGTSNLDVTLVSYYENNSYYHSHKDTACISAITWLFKEPKAFTGGDLILESKERVECINNRMLIIPSMIFHEVEEVCLSTLTDETLMGRFTISQFLIHT